MRVPARLMAPARSRLPIFLKLASQGRRMAVRAGGKLKIKQNAVRGGANLHDLHALPHLDHFVRQSPGLSERIN